MLTPEQVMADVVSHAACAEGIAWVTGKDSDQVWAATDEMAAPYLFWWAVQNAGQPGWHPTADILSVLNILMGMYGDYDASSVPLIVHEFTLIGNRSFTEDSMRFYVLIERVVRWKNPDPAALTAFRLKILTIIKTGLEPTI
jgi:hypothetical protein